MPPPPESDRPSWPARLAARAAIDGAVSAAAAAAVATLIGWVGGGDGHALGVAVLVAWLAAGSGLQAPRLQGPDLYASLGTVVVAWAGGLLGLVHGVHADAVAATGSLDEGFAQALATLLELGPRGLALPVGVVFPFVCTTFARRAAWPIRRQLLFAGQPILALVAVLGALGLLITVEGPGALPPRTLVALSLALLAWACGPPLIYALADRVERRLLA